MHPLLSEASHIFVSIRVRMKWPSRVKRDQKKTWKFWAGSPSDILWPRFWTCLGRRPQRRSSKGSSHLAILLCTSGDGDPSIRMTHFLYLYSLYIYSFIYSCVYWSVYSFIHLFIHIRIYIYMYIYYILYTIHMCKYICTIYYTYVYIYTY